MLLGYSWVRAKLRVGASVRIRAKDRVRIRVRVEVRSGLFRLELG